MTDPSDPPSAARARYVDHVLVVDDDRDDAAALAARLCKAGFQVTLAHEPAAARQAVPHFVGVLELEVGGESGVILAYDLLAAGCVHHVVFFTGIVQPGSRTGASDVAPVFAKSDGFDALVAQLRWLRGR